MPQLDLDNYGMPLTQARVAVRVFLASLGPCEIIGDALKWDWPLFLELLGPPGLPESIIGCREIDVECLDENQFSVDPPHHALLDARILRDMSTTGCATGNSR